MSNCGEPTLFKVPAIKWVLDTSQKMQKLGASDRASWNRLWLETYEKLGGQSSSCGTKPCPRAAAYGLWYSGAINGSIRRIDPEDTRRIRDELGKNAAYAVLAHACLKNHCDQNTQELWRSVRLQYKKVLREEPAGAEQQEVRLTMILFSAGQLI
jgi:hypothetical protein